MNSKICPKCGSVMLLRKARKGKYAGRSFWGCSNYPRCKHIINLEGEFIDIDSHNKNNIYDTISQNFEIPVKLQAREKFQDYQVKFFETLAIPEDLINLVNNEDIDRKELTKVSQWRLDFPIKTDSRVEENLLKIILIAQKILTRGRITLTSPDLEEKFKKYFKFDSDKLNIANYNFVKATNKTEIWFDGQGTEKYFYEKFLFEALGPYYKKLVIPQVHFSSLIQGDNVEESTGNQRVDFLITTPDKKIIVEIDDEEHKKHQSRDNERNIKLVNSGYEIFRINNYEVKSNQGENIDQLRALLKNYYVTEIKKYNSTDYYLLATKFSHQVQLTIIEAILSGFLVLNNDTHIYLDDISTNFKKKDLQFIFDNAVEDLFVLLNKIAKLYGVDINLNKVRYSFNNQKIQKNSIVITYNDNLISNIPRFVIQDISFPSVIACSERASMPAIISNPQESNLEYFLHYIFRHEKFMEGQFEAISRALSGMDAIVLLPTGGGKSVAFQLAGMLLPGVAIVVDPIIALMDDQVDNLRRIGIDRVISITSAITNPEIKTKIIQLFGQGEFLYCYVAPERFQTEEFRNNVKSLTTSIPVALIAIDEAHCVSEWGHDFRTSYLNIGRITRDCCRYKEFTPPLLALTGTASYAVLRDIKRELQIEDFDAIITPKTFDRPEMHFSVYECNSAEKSNILSGYIQRKLPSEFNMTSNNFYQPRGSKTNCGILFCPHVGGDFGIVEWARIIENNLHISINYYGGRSPDGWGNLEWNKYKEKTAKDFKNNKFPFLVATKSFGMGIDKPNIRFTIHLGIPQSIESFYQEAGRAGRDRKKSECTILVSNDNPGRSNQLLALDKSCDEIARIMEEERERESDDDITRAMWFHYKAFRGVNMELKVVDKIIQEINDFSSMHRVFTTFSNINDKFLKSELGINIKQKQIANEVKLLKEKAVHRLVILGVISDYTIDYSTGEYHITVSGIDISSISKNYEKYVRGYNRSAVPAELKKLEQYKSYKINEFIHYASLTLIDFIYRTIEKGRRRALREMLLLAENAMSGDADKKLRERLLRYLETSHYEEIEEIINSEKEGLQKLICLIDGEVISETDEVYGGIRSPKDAAEIRGQAGRYLESIPEHPGLLFLRAISEVYCRDCDSNVVEENMMAGIKEVLKRGNVSKFDVYDFLAWFMLRVYEKKSSIYHQLILKLLYTFNDIEFAHYIIKMSDLEEGMLYEPSTYIFNRFSREAINIY